MDLLLEPFQYAFFVRALLAGVLVGGLCGALSIFVVLRHMSYIGHGLAHAVLGGVAVAVALGYDLYLGAAVATVVSAVLIDRVARRRGLHADASIGIVTTAVFALGVLVLSVTPVRVNLEAMLFGNILGVTNADLWVAGTVAALLSVVFLFGWKSLVAGTATRAVGSQAAVHNRDFHQPALCACRAAHSICLALAPRAAQTSLPTGRHPDRQLPGPVSKLEPGHARWLLPQHCRGQFDFLLMADRHRLLA